MPEGKVSKLLRFRIEVPAPFKASALAEFVATVPDEAEVTISTVMGGDQRTPYPVKYILTANIETGA